MTSYGLTMTYCVTAVCIVLSLEATAPVSLSAAQTPPQDCANAAECRALTESAIAQADYERAHDLAWRAVQRGPRNDAALMYLLARAQALSGRPDDALVMLKRLAEMGVAADANTEEFRRTRDLPGWPAVDALITRAEAPANTPLPLAPSTPSVAPRSAKAPAVAPPKPVGRARAAKSLGPEKSAKPTEPVEPVEPGEPGEPAEPEESAGSFSSREFAPGGLVCDAVSRRFVFGDRPGRKLLVVAEGADGSVDLTRAESAGFFDVMALDIDTTRGDLWVVSAEAESGAATLHKLQLISGRALKHFDVPADLAPVRPIDLAVTASGAVLILDGVRSRVLVLQPGAPELEVLANLRKAAPSSLAPAGRDGIAYIAHRDGVSRVDLRTRAVTPLSGPGGSNLGGIERLRRHGTELIGVQAMPDRSRRVVRLVLDAAGRAITRVRVMRVALPAAGVPALSAVCGDTLALLIGETDGTTDRSSTAWRFRRISLAP